MKRVVVLLLVLVCVFALIAVSAQASGPTAQEIQKEIDRQGKSWTAKDYGRTFAAGALGTPTSLPPKSDVVPLALPTSLDWRNKNGKNYVTQVRDQGTCGSCWIFGAVATVESQFLIAADQSWWMGNESMNLAEQIVLDCSGGGDCSGGYPDLALNFLRDYGTEFESCAPYIAQKRPTCQSGTYPCAEFFMAPFSRIRIGSYSGVGQSETGLMTALQTGPVMTWFKIYEDFYSYGGGVYEYVTGSFKGYHIMSIVGYVQTPDQYGGGYFIVKNSWGTGWGESGFVKIGFSQISVCDLGAGARSIQMKSYSSVALHVYCSTIASGQPQPGVPGVTLAIKNLRTGVTVGSCVTDANGRCDFWFTRENLSTGYEIRASRPGKPFLSKGVIPWPWPEGTWFEVAYWDLSGVGGLDIEPYW